MASEPPMRSTMAATASAWASVFSPVLRVSPAISGSANARARASMFSMTGERSAVAADSAVSLMSAPAGEPCCCCERTATKSLRPIQSIEEKVHHDAVLFRRHQGRRMADFLEFDNARAGTALAHGLRGLVRQQV